MGNVKAMYIVVALLATLLYHAESNAGEEGRDEVDRFLDQYDPVVTQSTRDVAAGARDECNPAYVRELLTLAEQGNDSAQTCLGSLYLGGLGVRRDTNQGVKWLSRAAEQGNTRAQSFLGLAYWYGDGVPQDYVVGYSWFNIAARYGASQIVEVRDHMASQLTTEQLAEGQRLAREWRPTREGSLSGNEEPPGERAEAGVTGTGFVVSKEGHVITNHHVVADCTDLYVTSGGRPKTAEEIDAFLDPVAVIAQDAQNDLALLKMSGQVRAVATFRSGKGVRQGDGVVVVGYPLHGLLAAGPSVTVGNISALAGPGDDTRLFQITAPVQPGNSGGPLLDESGNVIGLVVAKLDAIAVATATGDIPQNVNFAISATIARAFLDAHGINYQAGTSVKKVGTADIAEAAKRFTVLVECRS